MYSGFINDLDDVQELIFVLTGYGGTDLNGFLQDLKKYKTIKLDEDDGADVKTLSIEIPVEAREKGAGSNQKSHLWTRDRDLTRSQEKLRETRAGRL